MKKNYELTEFREELQNCRNSVAFALEVLPTDTELSEYAKAGFTQFRIDCFEQLNSVVSKVCSQVDGSAPS
ncbi:hypothetical protein [Pseudomonas proteolytica]|uniref:hypothetical protein n=1 Tax=Pseudomonas proteolytica TaxID=219574 RepID=UPI001428CBB0|nr:hypothetical protein [Pseudomonas proteolytica]